MEPKLTLKKNRIRQVFQFALESIPTLFILAILLGIGFWGTRTEWTFKYSFSNNEEAKKQESQKANKASLWKSEPGPEKNNPFEKALILAPNNDAVNLAELQFQTLTEQPFIKSISSTGYIEFDNSRKGNISSKAPGVVAKIFKKQGDKVLKGQTIALIDSTDVGKAKTDFVQSLVLKDNRQKSLERGQLAASVIPERQIRELEMAFREIEIKNLADRQTLVNFGFTISEDAYKNLSDKEIFKKICEIGIPEEIILESKNTLSANLLPIKAPFDGQIIAILKGVGESVSSSDAQCVLADPSNLILMFNLPLESVQLVKVGQEFKFKADLVDDQFVSGKIDWVSPELDDKTHTVKVKASFANKDGKLRPNTFGKGEIIIGKQEKAIVITDSSLQYIDNKAFVFIRLNATTFQIKFVELGNRNGEKILVIKGLQLGDTIITIGSHLLRAELLSKLEM